MRTKKAAAAPSCDEPTALLRGVLAVLIQRERREGVSLDELAATLRRVGMPHAQAAVVLGTTPDGARVAAGRGKKRPGSARRVGKKGASDE